MPQAIGTNSPCSFSYTPPIWKHLSTTAFNVCIFDWSSLLLVNGTFAPTPPEPLAPVNLPAPPTANPTPPVLLPPPVGTEEREPMVPAPPVVPLLVVPPDEWIRVLPVVPVAVEATTGGAGTIGSTSIVCGDFGR